MRPRSILSLCLYYVGDYICEVAFRKDIRMMWWHKMYGNLMIMSHRLDTHEEVWNKPEQEIVQPKYIIGDEDQPVHQI